MAKTTTDCAIESCLFRKNGGFIGVRSAYIVIPTTVTPGSGFGSAGEGDFRISAFNSRANAEEVCRRLKALLA